MLEQIRLVGAKRDDDSVGQLEAHVAPHCVDAMVQVANTAFSDELLVKRRVECDRERAVLADREALDCRASAVQHLVGA